MVKQALVGGDTDLRSLDLPVAGLPAQLPGELTNLCQGLSRDSFAETGQTPGDVNRNPAAQRRVAAPQPGRRLSPGDELQVLDPVEFKRRGQVVDLRQADVLGAYASFLVGFERYA